MFSVLSIIMDIKEIGESDLLVTFFTREKGKLKGIAKGAKRSKRRFFNCLDLFFLSRIEMELKRGDLYFLHSCKLIEPFKRIREDYKSFVVASYMIELTDVLFPIRVADENMFDILKNSLLLLENRCDLKTLLIDFQAKAISLAGYRINLERCQICGRPYEGKGKGAFLVYKGGIVCLRCIKNVNSSVIMEPQEINILRLLQLPSFKIDNHTPFPDKIVEKIGFILYFYIDYILGRRLKTKRFIQSLFPFSQVLSKS